MPFGSIGEFSRRTGASGKLRLPRLGRPDIRLTGWLLAATLALNLIAAVLMPSLTGRAAHFDLLAICTSYAMVQPDGKGDPGDKASFDGANICVFCLPLMKQALNVPFQAPFVLILLAVSFRYFFINEKVLRSARLSSASARAPPRP